LVLWIDCKQEPVRSDFAAALPNRIPQFSVSESGPSITDLIAHPEGMLVLYNLACKGAVTLRAKPALGLTKITLSQFGLLNVACRQWGEFESISPEKLIHSGFESFLHMKSGYLTDGMIYTSEEVPETAWVYFDIRVNFRELIKWSHPTEGAQLRLGSEVNLLSPEKSDSENQIPETENKDRGGRPPKWDWAEAINDTWAALFAGELLSDKRPSWHKHMADWFAENDPDGRHPADSEISKRTKMMQTAMDDWERKTEPPEPRKTSKT
jgi:hypothetical protein